MGENYPRFKDLKKKKKKEPFNIGFLIGGGLGWEL